MKKPNSETEYLLSSPKNAAHLERSISQLRSGKTTGLVCKLEHCPLRLGEWPAAIECMECPVQPTTDCKE